MRRIEKKIVEILEYFLDDRDKLKEITREELTSLMKIATDILRDDGDDILKNKSLNILYYIAFLDCITLEECWQIYYIIVDGLFLNNRLSLFDGGVDDIYKHIYKSIKALDFFEYEYKRINERNENKIVIITSQFLGIDHAPTRRVLDYSYAIKKHLNKEVFIINDSGIHFDSLDYLKYRCYYFEDNYSNIKKIIYKDERFDFYQVKDVMPNIESILGIVDLIHSINPLLVYNIGDSSISSDLCTGFTTTITLPCSHEIPITCSKYLLVGRSLEERDNDYLQRLEDYQKIVKTVVNYEMEENNNSYTREQFGIPDEKFVIAIVGNRLETELDAEILKTMDKVISSYDIHISFIGDITNKQEILNNFKDCNQIKLHFLGHQNKASKITKVLDLYLNPMRKGGGRSAFEALHYGVPVVTLKYGDVYYTSGEEFSVENYNEMFEVIGKYIKDKEYYEKMQRKALERGQILSDITGTQEKIINGIIENERRYTNE